MKKMIFNDIRTKLIMLSKGNKIDNIENIYYPYRINSLRYLFGATVMHNQNNNEVIFIRNICFGYDLEETRSTAEEKGYKSINDSLLLKGNLEVLNHGYRKAKRRIN